jgi:hypothetical protein
MALIKIGKNDLDKEFGFKIPMADHYVKKFHKT